MDGFEARIQFNKLLERLNGGTSCNSHAVTFMLQHKEVSEDLYNCMIESVDQLSMNGKLNILFLLTPLVEQLQRIEPHHPYKEWLERDLEMVVGKVVPPNHAGFLNLDAAKRAVDDLQRQAYLDQPTVKLIRDNLENFDTTAIPDRSAVGTTEWTTANMLQRMEEDRERAKRQKEDIWAVDYSLGNFAEFETRWQKQGPLEQLDHEQMREDNEIVQASLKPSSYD